MGSCRSGAGLGQYLWKDSASAILSAWENSCAVVVVSVTPQRLEVWAFVTMCRLPQATVHCSMLHHF